MPETADLMIEFSSIPWFMDLTQAQKESLALIAQIIHLPKSEDLFSEGDRIDMVYVLLEGQISLETFVPSFGPVETYKAEPLDILGWSALTLVSRQRTSTARAISNCKLIALEGNTMKMMCEQDHDLGYKIMKRMVNVVASRFLSTRIQLYDIIRNEEARISN